METQFTPHGESVIASAIKTAQSAGRHVATVSGNYEISGTVILPSDFTLVLEDCHLRMADGTVCQMFRNAASLEAGAARRGADADHNVALIGRGRAILDGGNYNGLSEKNSEKDGNPHISQNNLLLFSNVDGFRVEGIHARNQRWWALNFFYCRHGVIRDVDFLADCTRIDESGERVRGLSFDKYDQTYIKNADGIDLRLGCHDILIENITGFTEDDTIALTALRGSSEALWGVADLCPDIRDVIIRNVKSAAFCSNVRLLNQGGTKMRNILIDGVMDTSADTDCVERGLYAVRIGDTHLYGERHCVEGENCGVTVRNVWSRAMRAAVSVAGIVTDFRFDNIHPFDGCPAAFLDDNDTDAPTA